MTWIDTHTHFDDVVFNNQRDLLWQKAKDNHVLAQFLMGTSKNNWETIKTFSRNHLNSFYALGIHPFFIDQSSVEFDLNLLAKTVDEALANPLIQSKFIGLGEIGLDNQYAKKNNVLSTIQTQVFITQLNLAKKQNLPVFIHGLKADYDAISKHLKSQGIYRGVVHAFNGSYEQAKSFIDLGFKLGVGGSITYPNRHKLRTVLKQLPISAIVLETDTPHVPLFDGEQFSLNIRDSRNDKENFSYSYQLPKIAECLISLKQEESLTLSTFSEKLMMNISDIFKQTVIDFKLQK